MQLAVLRVLADEGVLHLLPPLALCPGGPVPYLTGGTLPPAVLELYMRLMADSALERSVQSGSAAAELALYHVAGYLFPDTPAAGAALDCNNG